MEVVVMKVVGKEAGSVVAGGIRTCIGPLPDDSLDEALGLAISLGPVGSGEAVLEAGLEAGGGEEFGAVGRAAVGEEALDFDA